MMTEVTHVASLQSRAIAHDPNSICGADAQGTLDAQDEQIRKHLRYDPGCSMGARIRLGRMAAERKGYWTGGNLPYGMRRLLLDAKGNPLRLLEPGERKTVRKHRVVLVAGEPAEVAAIRQIFCQFVDLGYTSARIADELNAHGIPAADGKRWTARRVLACLRKQAYAAPINYRSETGRQGQRWVRLPEGGQSIVSLEQFERAQEMLAYPSEMDGTPSP